MTGTADPNEPQPYAPEGVDRVGTPPSSGSGGTGGERGSSAFDGNSEFTGESTLKEGVTTPTEGPARGVDYYVTDDQRREGESRAVRPPVESGSNNGDGDKGAGEKPTPGKAGGTAGK